VHGQHLVIGLGRPVKGWGHVRVVRVSYGGLGWTIRLFMCDATEVAVNDRSRHTARDSCSGM